VSDEGGSVSRARAARFDRARTRRLDEARCAWEFLIHGDTRGVHADDCVFAARGEPACSRDYDPGTPPEDEKMYAHTGIGTLYGWNTNEAWQLAGWNVKGRGRA
jgi:hypothetical protein